VPAGAWGDRVLAAFKQELQGGGGELLGTALIDASRTDYSGSITEVLRISDSTAATGAWSPHWAPSCSSSRGVAATSSSSSQRHRQRRAPAAAAAALSLRGDIPTYATSDAFDRTCAPTRIWMVDVSRMPWILGGDLADAVRSATREPGPAAARTAAACSRSASMRFAGQALRRGGATRNISLEG